MVYKIHGIIFIINMGIKIIFDLLCFVFCQSLVIKHCSQEAKYRSATETTVDNLEQLCIAANWPLDLTFKA